MMDDCKYNMVTLISHDIDEFLANQTDKLIRFNHGAYSVIQKCEYRLIRRTFNIFMSSKCITALSQFIVALLT